MNQWLAGSLAIAFVLAGCAGTSDAPKDDVDHGAHGQPFARNATGMVPVAPDPATFLGTIANDHVTGQTGHAGHQVPELHAGSHNLRLLGHSTLSDGLVGPSSGFIENHVVGDLMLVSSIFGSRGATLVDISDPSNMRVLSHIYNLDDNWDSRISADGKYVFIGCQGSGAFDCTGIEMRGESPSTSGGSVCTSAGVPSDCPGGIAIYDIDEPSDPRFQGYLPMGFTHNVYSYIRDGKYYFMNAGVHIAEWDAENRTYQSASTNVSGVHDIHVQQHPITGEWLLYTGGSGGSMTIWNVDDPFDPQLIGAVDRDGTDIPPLWHEQTPMPCLIGGRHITIGAGESGGGLPAHVGIVDTTDPRNPVALGSWILPDHEDITAQNMYRYSLHNIDGNCDGQVAVAMYHAGVWVFDISTPERMLEPATLAYYLPHERPIGPGITGWSPITGAPVATVISGDTPNTWSAQWSTDGAVLFVPDMTTGVYALEPTWDVELPAADG